MEFIKYCIDRYHINNKTYTCYNRKKASTIKMCIIGGFLFNDVGDSPDSFRKWFFDEKYNNACSNATVLEKENGFILLRDLDPVLEEEIENPTEVKMTKAQFLQLLNDWEEMVLKVQPNEVIIKYENDQYIFETKN